MGIRLRRSTQSRRGRRVFRSKELRVLCGSALIVVGTIASSLVYADGEKIAVFTKNQTNPYFQMLRMGADNAAKQMNARVTHYVPTRPDSIPDQMSQVEDVVTKRPDAVVFVPVDWLWVGTAIQTNQQDASRPALRLRIFAVALAAVFMAIALPAA